MVLAVMHFPPLLPPVAVGRSGPGVMRAGELALPLTSCSIQMSKPLTSPGHHSRVGPEGVSMGELALPLVCHVVTWARERCPPLTSSLATWAQVGELALR